MRSTKQTIQKQNKRRACLRELAGITESDVAEREKKIHCLKSQQNTVEVGGHKVKTKENINNAKLKHKIPYEWCSKQSTATSRRTEAIHTQPSLVTHPQLRAEHRARMNSKR
jgi:hypothetical protein